MSQIDTLDDEQLAALRAENASLLALVADLRTVSRAQEAESAGLEAERDRLRTNLEHRRQTMNLLWRTLDAMHNGAVTRRLLERVDALLHEWPFYAEHYRMSGTGGDLRHTDFGGIVEQIAGVREQFDAGAGEVLASRLAALESRCAAMREALLRLEKDSPRCPACSWVSMLAGGGPHAPDCWLASALQGGAGERGARILAAAARYRETQLDFEAAWSKSSEDSPEYRTAWKARERATDALLQSAMEKGAP